MKTLHLTNAWHERSGGIATFYRALLASAERRKQAICLIVPSSADSVEEVGLSKIYRVASRPAPLNPDYRVIKPPAFLYSGSRIQQILNAERPDLVEICDKYHLNYLGALLRLRLLHGVRFQPTVVGLSCERMDDNFAAYVSAGAMGRAFSRFYMRYLYFPFFDHHIVNSRHTAEELIDVSNGHPVDRGIWRMPMGVDLSSFRPSLRSAASRRELLQRIGVSEPCKLLVYAGRLAPEKNLALLIGTMKRLQGHDENFHLLIAGDGIARAALQEQADSLPRKCVHFLGHVSERSQLAQLFADCDAFVHPNPREPFGITPLEAMASALPLVAPNSGGVTEYADSENAYVAPADEESYAAAVLAIFSDETRRARVVANALETARRYDWQRVTDEFLDLYDTIHQVAQGKLSLQNSGALHCSVRPRNGGGVLTAVAETSKKAFTTYIQLRSALEKSRHVEAAADSGAD